MAKRRAPRVEKQSSSSPSSRASRTTRSRLQDMLDENRLGATGSSSLDFLMDTDDSNLSCDQAGNQVDWASMNDGSDFAADTMEDMAMQETMLEPTSQPRNKGKARLVEAEVQEQPPFRFMDLPAEIRLEIYRACLTRPKNIMLSKVEKPPQSEDSSALKHKLSEQREVFERAKTSRHFDPVRASTATHTPTISSSTRSSRSSAMANRMRAHQALRSRRNRSSFHSNVSPESLISAMATVPPSNGSTVSSDTSSAGVAFQFDSISPQAGKATPMPPKNEDALIVNLLRASKQVYKEARDVLYGENIFELDIATAIPSLAPLHQRSRRQIKHAILEIPTHNDILDLFSEVVRLSLRYCTGLKMFVIRTPFTLPGADNNAFVYANGFEILRWLPQQCKVVLEGRPNPEIQIVVEKHMRLAQTQDEVNYTRHMSQKLEGWDY